MADDLDQARAALAAAGRIGTPPARVDALVAIAHGWVAVARETRKSTPAAEPAPAYDPQPR